MSVKYTYTIFAVLVLNYLCFVQTKTDYWLRQADSLKEIDFVKAKLFTDSAYNYAVKSNDKVFLARAHNSLGNLQLAKGNYQKALEHFNIAFPLAVAGKNKNTLANVINNKAICQEKMGNYSESLKLHMESLKMREELGEPKEILIGQQNLGVVYFYIGNLNQSIKYSAMALETALSINDSVTACQLNDNLGATYFNAYKDSLALAHYSRALEIARKLKYSKGIESVSNNLSALYIETGRPAEAKKHLKVAMTYLNENPLNKVSILHNLGKVFEKENRVDSAIFYFKSALKLAEEIRSPHKRMVLYDEMSKIYYTTKKFDLAFEYKTRYHNLKDSLNNEKNLKNIAETEAIYKTEKQAKEIELLNTENERQKESAEARKKFLLVSLGALVLAVFAAIAFYLNFRNKKRDNIILQDKNAEIQKQKDLIAEKNKEIVDSINYAKRLQEAILPPVESIQNQLPQSFVLYKPKDIVAGDFYWMHVAKQKQILIAVADCTGHGVPGAMVSVVCANALNAAVKEFGLSEPAKILDKVNELVEETFEKSSSEVRDGMDISLLRIESLNENPDNKLPKGKLVIPKGQSLADVVESNKKYNIQWAGANNPLWYISNGVWAEVKADKQPVGKFDHRKPFTNHNIQLKAGDSLFLISDGFADQFGGADGKKIKNKALKELLFKNSNQQVEQQKEILDKEFTNWKGSYEQVDDVCVMGIRL